MNRKHTKETTKKVSTGNIPAMLLAVDGDVVYLGDVVKGLTLVQKEARKLANNLSEEEIKKGIKNTIYIEGEKPTTTKENTIVIYHVPFKEESSKTIKSFDIPEMDHSSIDHIKIINQLILSVEEKIKDAEIILCTTKKFGSNFKSNILKKIYPAADAEKPMYNRVKTYNTLIQHNLVGKNVIFMDSDTLVISNPWEILKELNFSLAVTYRYSPNLMPINEGIIYCKSTSRASKRFFARYIQTYEKIKHSEIINSIVKTDLERWRGGQLSLNGVCNAGRMVTYKDSTDDILFLPCDTYNRTIYSYEELKTIKNKAIAFIAHAKGNAKINN